MRHSKACQKDQNALEMSWVRAGWGRRRPQKAIFCPGTGLAGAKTGHLGGAGQQICRQLKVGDGGGARSGNRGGLRPHRTGGAGTGPNGTRGRLLGAARDPFPCSEGRGGRSAAPAHALQGRTCGRGGSGAAGSRRTGCPSSLPKGAPNGEGCGSHALERCRAQASVQNDLCKSNVSDRRCPLSVSVLLCPVNGLCRACTAPTEQGAFGA